jgi:hypothetical protein
MCQSARLRRAARARIRRRRVQAVLEDVEVEAAEVFGAEGLQRLDDAVELVAFVIGDAAFLQLAGQRQRVAVDFQPLVDRQHVLAGVEIGGIGEQEAQRVADAAVAFDDALEDFVGNRQLAGVVGRRRPQAQDFGAHLVRHLLRRDDVALRLRHLVALAVDDEAVRQQRLVRGAAVDGAAGEQRRLEPAAMLVGTFEIHVGRIGEIAGVRAAQHVTVRGAGVEPDVERVLHLDVAPGFVPEQFGGIQPEPGFDALLLDPQRDLFDQFGGARVRQRRFPCAGRRGSAPPSCAGARRTSPAGCFIIASRRARPQDGKNCVSSTARSAIQRSVEAFSSFLCSMPMNHCVVARKMIGVLWRQQCG